MGKRNNNPIDIFSGDDGSIFLLPIFTHREANTGASRIIKIGLNDWNQEAGISHPKIDRWVVSSAKKVSDAPACSNADQKKITKKQSIKITQIRCRSITVNDLSEIIKPGTATAALKVSAPI